MIIYFEIIFELISWISEIQIFYLETINIYYMYIYYILIFLLN